MASRSSSSLLRPLAALRRALAAQRAYSAASAAAPPPTPKGTYVLPLPQLSPTMERGAVSRWHVREGERFPAYTVLATVSTTELVEPAYAEGAFAGRVRMLVEAQDAGVVARLLVPADDQDGGNDNASPTPPRDLPVNTPIAVVVGEDELEEAESDDEREAMLAAARAWEVPKAPLPPPPLLEWQSYLADDKGDQPRKGGCGCG